MRKTTVGIGLLTLLGVLYCFVPWACEENHSPTGPRFDFRIESSWLKIAKELYLSTVPKMGKLTAHP